MNDLNALNELTHPKKHIAKARLYGKRLSEIVLTILICAGIMNVLNYIYVNDYANDSSSWERAVMKEFYSQEENIDYLYIGSSHIYMDIIPAKLDEINGRNNFNLSTSAQPMMASYYLLKEALKYHSPKHVYLEMYYMIPCIYGDLDNAEVVTRHWETLYQMPLSLNKLDYKCHLANKKFGMMTFFPIRQYSEHLFDTAYIKVSLEQKQTDYYRNYIHIWDERAPLFEKGFCTTLDYVEPGTFEGNSSAIPTPIFDSNSEKYFNAIIDLCRKENISLTLFTSPMPDFRVRCIGNYDQYVACINELAEKNGLRYYDFNLCSPKYLDLQDDTCFVDHNHLNYKGAQLYTDVLGEVLLDELEGRPIPEDMFYDSYEEKMLQIDKRIFGLDIQADTTQEEKTYMIYSIDNLTEAEAEFRITKMCEDASQPVVIQEWSTHNCVTFPDSETGLFIVEARPTGSEEVTNRVETAY